jgi:hypothetical protein
MDQRTGIGSLYDESFRGYGSEIRLVCPAFRPNSTYKRSYLPSSLWAPIPAGRLSGMQFAPQREGKAMGFKDMRFLELQAFIYGIAFAFGGLITTGYTLSGSAPAPTATWQAKAVGPALVIGGLLMSWVGYRGTKRGKP